MKIKSLKNLIAITGLLFASGCASVEPWVKPYERQNLADELMLPGRHAVSIAYLNHVHEAREGARGATGAGGGGCGCN